MRVAVVTKIFPSSLEPLSAPFQRQQILELARLCDIDVLVAVPHVPLVARALRMPKRAARLAALPPSERVHDIPVTYVRQLYLPRIGLSVAVPLYLASLLPHRNRLRVVDVVLATWAYPDACAAVLAARALGKPCVVKVHGTDVNVVLRRPAARRLAARVLPRADAVVAVSRPLADELVRLGVPAERVSVVTNGVDGSLFYPRDRAKARRVLDVPDRARVILFVGRLEPQKGVWELLSAFEQVRSREDRAVLVLIGDGVSKDEVRAHAARRADREAAPSIRVLGPKPHAEVAEWMGVCDVLALPSWAEGMPNVVLEALASGRAVVATSVGGIPGALSGVPSAILVPPRDRRALADALFTALSRRPDKAGAPAAPGSWKDSARALHDVLSRVVAVHTRIPTRQAKGLACCYDCKS